VPPHRLGCDNPNWWRSPLVRLLEDDQVFAHPWVRGELALGSLRDRTAFLELLESLPQVEPATDAAVLALVEQRRLLGRGVGWVDAQLLAACVNHPCRLWTRDRRLAAVAQELGVQWGPVS